MRAVRWGISRSELYSKALGALLAKHHNKSITTRLNEIYGSDREDSPLDSTSATFQHRTLEQNK